MIAGKKVEMRRWFTFLDGSKDLDLYWNTALLALVVEFLLDGKACPWRLWFLIDSSLCLFSCGLVFCCAPIAGVSVGT